jgi:hypothetical protein
MADADRPQSHIVAECVLREVPSPGPDPHRARHRRPGPGITCPPDCKPRQAARTPPARSLIVTKQQWLSAQVYPSAAASPLRLTREQADLLQLFQPVQPSAR